jgi:hypothetical protein
MPYFHNDKCNILFIHIPKTAGTSIEKYLSNKYSIELSTESLYGFAKLFRISSNKYLNKISLQHHTLHNILTFKDIYKIDTECLKIFCVVRNPYERIISDIFWQDLVSIDDSHEIVNKVIQNYVLHNMDNHNIPQYKFICDNNEKIYKNVLILKFENLKEDMKKIGFDDMNVHINEAKYIKTPFYYLNDESIKIINKYYEKDFIFFDYEMKCV